MAKKIKLDLSARLQIMKVALKLFAEKGFPAVSVREIAKKSGHNISMISYYFGGKEGLYKAIIADHMLKTIEEVRKIFLSRETQQMTKTSFRSEIRSMVALVTNMKFESPEMTNIMQRERVDSLPFARELHEKLIDPVADQVIEVFKQAQKKGIVRANIDSRVFMGMLFESVMGYFTMHQCGLKTMQGDFKFPRDKEKFIDFVTDLFSEGIMK
jgi:TetR/AcrR family transcriptional regulator